MLLKFLQKVMSLIILCFGVFAFGINAYGEKLDYGNYENDSEFKDESSISRKPAREELLYIETEYVLVEPLYVNSSKNNNTYELQDYKERRKKWGSVIGLSYSTFEPLDYSPNYSADDFDTVYADAESPLIEFNIYLKRNYSAFSIGLELSVGSYSTKSAATATDDSTLSLTPAKLGVKLAMDALFNEPWIVPYASGGVYTIDYLETQGSGTYEGNTNYAGYYTVGAMFQLNWAEPNAARDAYEESGIENTFLFVEASQLLTSQDSAPEDPNFETDVFLKSGISLEF